MLKSARGWLFWVNHLRVVGLLFSLLFIFFFFIKPSVVDAALGQAGVTDWQEDHVVTEVGKSAERARELLYWTMSHPAINRAQVISKMWAFTRNVVYVFFIIVIAVGGIGIVVSKRQGNVGPIFSGISSPFAGLNPGTLIMRIAALLVYATFSYVFVLGLIEFAQILQNFFIDKLEGCRLFNINFGAVTKCLPDSLAEYQNTVKNMEQNYINFIGYRDFDPRKQEMVNTSLFYIRLTTLTYNVMSFMLILRDVVLWFLMVVAPILALLMPFTFIRNVGWIWIGVFLQWLFYGPLFTLFIGSVVKIWGQGIPYGFDFSRVPVNGAIDENISQLLPFQTSINILWGGPAQTLDVFNSANYIDTFAEYVVSLIMLWVAIMLPWLLLRIFRDYCCDILKQNQGTLKAIYSQLRNNRTPDVPPSGPSVNRIPAESTANAMRLPFRKVIDEQKKTEESIRRSVSVEKMTNIKSIRTNELSKNLNITVNKLQDLARIETNESYQRNVREQLDRIANPVGAVTSQERQKYAEVRNELVSRAKSGDEKAARILQSASMPNIKEFVVGAGVASAERLLGIAQHVGVSGAQVSKISGILPTMRNLNQDEQLEKLIKETNVTKEQAEEILTSLTTKRGRVELARIPHELPTAVSVSQIKKAAEVAKVTEAQVGQVVRMLPTLSSISPTKQIEQIARETDITQEQAARVVDTLVLSKPIETGQEEETKRVTVDDYEEVKSMWLNHYRNSSIPLSGKIKTRADWINEDTVRITNALNLLQSEKPEIKEEGLSEVEKILPFLLLGGFSNDEVVVYMKAKLEAAKAVLEEVKNEAQKTQSTLQEEEKVFVDIRDTQKEISKSVMSEGKKELDINIEAAKAAQVEDSLPTGTVSADKKLLQVNYEANDNKEKIEVAPNVISQDSTRSKAVSMPVPSALSLNLAPLENILGELNMTLRKLQDMTKLEVDPKQLERVLRVVSAMNTDKLDEKLIETEQEQSQISSDDYEEIKNMWIRYYREAPVPQDQGFSVRIDWVRFEINALAVASELLSSSEKEKQKEGLAKYEYLVPLMLYGGFNYSDTVKYLMARKDAAEFVAKELELGGGGGDVFQGQVEDSLPKQEEPTDGIEPSTSVLPRLRSTN